MPISNLVHWNLFLGKILVFSHRESVWTIQVFAKHISTLLHTALFGLEIVLKEYQQAAVRKYNKKGPAPWVSVSNSNSNGKYLCQFCFGALTVEVRKKPQNCSATLSKIQDTLVGIHNFPSLKISLNVTGSHWIRGLSITSKWFSQ